MQSLDGLTKVMRENFRACGFPIVLSRPFDKRTPSHQCGTVTMGDDPATAPLDPFCRSFDHQNLFVVDASFLPTSAAVTRRCRSPPRRLRVADHITRRPSLQHDPPRRHRHRRRRGIGLAIAPRPWPMPASTSPSPIWRERGADGLAADTRRRAARNSLTVTCDIADLAGHAALVDAAIARLRPHRLPRQQCRHRRRRCAATCSILTPENFDRDARHQPARHGLPHQAVAKAMLAGTPAAAHDRSSPSPRSAPRWPRRSAPTTASPRPGLPMWAKNLALRLAPRRHRRLRGAARHHPHRHDGRRHRQIRCADRRRPGAGATLGRSRATSARSVAALAAGASAFATGSMHQCRRRPLRAAAVRWHDDHDTTTSSSGAGPAGCVLANRLSEDPGVSRAAAGSRRQRLASAISTCRRASPR